MASRFSSMAAVLQRQAPWLRAAQRMAAAPLVCRSCCRNFSMAPQRLAARGRTTKGAAKEPPSSEWSSMNLDTNMNANGIQLTRAVYKSRLLIYDAGDSRTTWVSFWKAMALLQFGTTLVFAVPPLWTNENQPDPRLRKAQAVLVGILGTIPTLTMAYLTAPFAHQVFLQLPTHARRSRRDLMAFASSLVAQPAATANTKLDFVTLRIFPFRRSTSVFLHELRALPARRLRLANIEIPKTDAWADRQRAKGIWRRFLEVVNEPRFKFYVKEGRMYTVKTGAPGVWEEVARRIKAQTVAEAQREAEKTGAAVERVKRPLLRRPVVPSEVRERVKRQTSRTVERRNL
jgi:hypothetical protein